MKPYFLTFSKAGKKWNGRAKNLADVRAQFRLSDADWMTATNYLGRVVLHLTDRVTI